MASNVEQIRGVIRLGGGQEEREMDDDSCCGPRDRFWQQLSKTRHFKPA